jgi:hypothetical protein
MLSILARLEKINEISSDLKKTDWYNLRGAAYRIMKMTGQQRSQIVIGGGQG